MEQRKPFTGWTDVELSEKGRNEAQEAGKLLKAEGFAFDYAYTSVLKRAITPCGTFLIKLINNGCQLKKLEIKRTSLWRSARFKQS